MIPPVKAFVFDFDGTLARINIDFQKMRSAILALISSYRVNPDNGLKNLYVLEMIEAAKKIINHHDYDKGNEFEIKAYEAIKDIEIAGARNGKLFDGIEHMFTELRMRHVLLGIVTRNCFEAVKIICPDIESYLDTVITRELTSKVKPDPEHLHTALRILKVKPEHAAMVGDHPIDILVGKQLGAFTIGVLTGYSKTLHLQEAGADIIIHQATKILDLLD